METNVENTELVKLPIEERDGRTYSIRFSGVRVATTMASTLSEFEIYRSDDGRVIVYATGGQDYFEVDDLEELRDWLDRDVYIKVMNTLGITPEIDL